VALLRASLDSVFQQPAFRTATWGALIVSALGDTVYAHNAATLLIPASNMKIVTATTALAQLGPDFRFRDTALALAAGDTVPSDFGPMYDTIFVRDHPLRDVLPKMLKPSQNKLAEEIARTVALERTGSPSRDSAVAVAGRQLAAWNVPSDGYILFDGSGYDRANYLSAETIVHILTQARHDTAFAVFYDALPIAGVDGTLIRRMRATSAARNAHAKTGSLHAIRALSGYVTTAGGEELTFSFLCNAYTTEPDIVLHIMDQAVARLAELPGAP
jgi:D-alanyl-D-alanine carboxypeptidase/D-alanyl-D-alanine-endopeptidase (penicillin-binding protein 4)